LDKNLLARSMLGGILLNTAIIGADVIAENKGKIQRKIEIDQRMRSASEDTLNREVKNESKCPGSIPFNNRSRSKGDLAMGRRANTNV